MRKSAPKLSSDSHSYKDGTKRDDVQCTFEMGRSPSTQAIGLPMKMLLAEEMSKEIEHKKRTPSVVARLMGVEGLPSPKDFHGKQKASSNLYQQKTASNSAQLSPQFLDGLMSHRSSMNQHEVKDVYEDMRVSQFINRGCSSRWNTRSIPMNSGGVPIDPNFLDAKQMLEGSNDLDDTVEMVGCVKGKLSKFPMQPDSLVSKHPIGPQDSSKAYIGSPITVLTPLGREMCKHSAKYSRSGKQTSGEFRSVNLMKRKDGILLESNNFQRPYLSQSSPDVLLEERVEKNTLPTRIVLLKPYLGRVWNAGASCSLADLRHGDHEMGFSRPISREAREIAREVSVRIREDLDETAEEMSSAFRGYVGDDSSSESNDSDSGSKRQPLKLSYRDSCNESDFHAWSSLSRENTKQLSGKPKITQKYEDLEMFQSGNTFAKMLASFDRDSRSVYSTSKRRFGSCTGTSKKDPPFGINSKNGLKDDASLISSRSKSLPTSLGGINHRKCTYHGEMLQHSSEVYCDRNKVMKGKHNDKENHTNSGLSSGSEKPQYFQHLNVNFESHTKDSALDTPQMQLSANHESAPTCGKDSILKELPKEQVVQSAHSSTCPRSDPDSSESSKEADHLSPVSVLEVPTLEYTSPCENFERVSADLHELRKQLQLLKLESGTYTDTSTFAPAEDDNTSLLSENNLGLECECWQTSYAVDVLVGFGLEDLDFSFFKTKWDYPDSPLDQVLFSDLEKKYDTGTTGSKSERKLVFDRLNSALLNIFQDHINSYPWVMPKLGAFDSSWEKEAVRDAVERSMSRDFSKWESLETDLDKEMQWLDGRGEINHVGIDIEKLLIDEIVAEVFAT